MDWENRKDKPLQDDKAKEPIYSHTGTNYYAIFRVGRRFKQLVQIKGFQAHMQREMEVPNSNNKINNIILIGDKDIYNNVEKYLTGVKIRKDNVIATELLLTASHGFFNMPEAERNRWIQHNISWLKKEFGNNCVYAVLHKDEYTYHIHTLIVPKFQNSKGKDVLANKRYFGGPGRLSEWQDNYANNMQEVFRQLQRGTKFSKAKHVAIRNFYSLINENMNDKDIEQLAAKAKNAELTEIKLKSIQNTLQAYKNYSRKSDQEKEQLLLDNKEFQKHIKELNTKGEVYSQALDLLAYKYKVPKEVINQMVKYSEKSLSNERSR